MQDAAPPDSDVYIRNLKTIFLAGGLGVEDQRNSLRVAYFYRAELRRNFYLSKERTSSKLEQKFGIYFFRCSN